jgi:hypothetical protein
MAAVALGNLKRHRLAIFPFLALPPFAGPG